jgi:hypothetical protein
MANSQHAVIEFLIKKSSAINFFDQPSMSMEIVAWVPAVVGLNTSKIARETLLICLSAVN